MPEAMVEGEPITHEEASAPGWIDAIRRRATSSTTTTSKPAGASVGALRTGAASRVAAASRLPPLPTDHHRVIVRPGGGLDVPAAEEDIVCTNDTQNIFVISTPSLQTAEAYAKVRAIVLMERAHPVSAYVVASGTTSRGVVRGVDADLPDSELQRLRRRNNNQQTQGGSAKQQPTPKQPTPSPPTKHLPTTTKSPTATPTWADRVAGKGETRGSAQSGNLPQHEKDEIQELKRELALLRKENAEFKALIRNLQQPSERVVEAPTPAAPVVEPAPTTSSNASRAAKRRAAEDPPDEPVTMSKLMEALARLRADIAADRAADMTPHTLQLTELHARLQILEGQHTAVRAPTSMQ
ncbi:hypothetical protein HPB52_016324 [Rhipicephalus sanguineus]|uniref:Uncharacterized protein n=1 Tax=Rhipicephalus sanguineus TaxID=34632 RepID=A0A9D4PT78_RHISA|nr:hypothetical protein HPB52_016324 [Rhipicephalus sanguineus]